MKAGRTFMSERNGGGGGQNIKRRGPIDRVYTEYCMYVYMYIYVQYVYM